MYYLLLAQGHVYLLGVTDKCLPVNTELPHLKLLAAGELGHLAAQRGGGGGGGRGGGLLAGEGRPALGLHGGGLRVEAGGHLLLLLLGAGVSPPSLDT